MPIFYQCVACREEIYLPDSKAGLLSSCPRCRLKFLAPAPNMQMIPTGGAPPAPAPTPAPAPAQQRSPSGMGPVTTTPPSASSRPNLGAAANTVSGSGVRRPGPAPAPAPAAAGPGVRPAAPAASGTSRPPLGGAPRPQGAAPPPAAKPPASAQAKPATTPPPNAARPAAAAPSPAKPAPSVAKPAPAPVAAKPAPAPAPAPAKPSPPPSYPRDAAKPPLYPLEEKKPATTKKDSSAGLFGVKSGEVPALLFGSSDESIAMRPSELFADAIPSAPDAEMDDMDVPIDLAPSGSRRSEESDDEVNPAADEGGGVAVPVESDEASDANDRPAQTRTAPARPATPAASEPLLESGSSTDVLEMPGGVDSLISMDEIFSKQKAEESPAATAPPAFGKGGVLPAPFLKPADPEPAPQPVVSETPTEVEVPAPAPAAEPSGSPSGPVPFVLIPVEGISDARFDLPGGGVYLLGRDKDAHVKILSTSVSRRHARIDATGQDHVLIDLGSANGTQVNGQSVARQPLKDGDLIRMGKVILRYQGPGSK